MQIIVHKQNNQKWIHIEGNRLKPSVYIDEHILANEFKKNNNYYLESDKNFLANNPFYNDGYFYILPNNNENSKSWSYYIVKLDLDLNVIGKRRIDLKEKYDDRFTSSIVVDKEGFIYVASDKEMTITKFKPIKDGEDSHIDLSK